MVRKEAGLGWDFREKDVMCTGIEVCAVYEALKVVQEVEEVDEERQGQIKGGSLSQTKELKVDVSKVEAYGPDHL